MKAYQAYGKGSNCIADTPRAAAENYFNANPTRRKCDVVQGDYDGLFFTVTFGRDRIKTWKEITRKNLGDLPATMNGE